MCPIMIGHWIQPWPGENVLGEVVSVEGNRIVCRCRNGMRFTIDKAYVTDGILWPPDEGPTLKMLPKVAS